MKKGFLLLLAVFFNRQATAVMRSIKSFTIRVIY